MIVGSGVAGLRAAIELGAAGTTLILTKGQTSESITHQAQGGIAVALEDEKSIDLHLKDVLRSGDGLCREEAVRVLAQEGPAAIGELISWGGRFDWKSGAAAPSGRGARAHPRVLKGPGDTIGAEILRVLLEKAQSLPGLKKKHHTLVIELLVSGEEVCGVKYLDEESGAICEARASSVLLATGGLGQVYSETTNPPGACGAGVALAFRAGAVLSDMEFVQFHPTALHVKKAARIGLPEGLRHQGARLRNIDLERFMHRYHEAGELAPLDVVSRAIVIEMKKLRSEFVYLDMTGIDPEHVKKHFPHVYAACLQSNIDITSDLVPAGPAAHFAIGGVATNVAGATSLPGLYAAGEAAATGVHGANRLPNNSLLEGLVFGKRAAAAMVARSGPAALPSPPTPLSPPPWSHPGSSEKARAPASEPELESVARKIRDLMWSQVGVIREGKGMRDASRWLNGFALPGAVEPSRSYYELRNILEVARLITCCAAARQESRGVHYRSDFPLRNDAAPAKHSFISKYSSVYLSS